MAAPDVYPNLLRAVLSISPITGIADCCARDAGASAKPALSSGKTWRSNIAGRMASMIACRNWPPISFVAR